MNIAAGLLRGLCTAGLLLCALLAGFCAPAKPTSTSDSLEADVTQGALRVKTEAGGVVECPLRHTDVTASISGFIARVTVTQTFFNPYDEKIEAVYVFPLPHTAAVDDMTMVIGEKHIVGIIKRRAEARAIYEQALQQGLTASLLEQERPNIFTQSVGNISPKQEIRIVISYVDVLKYDMGTYEFHFPMVVGPRYIPGAPISDKAALPPELQGTVGEVKSPTVGASPKGTGWSPDTDRVPDASRVTPPVLKPGYRTGHDISLSVALDAGVRIQDIQIPNHKASLQRIGEGEASAKLTPEDSIPNKDFVMRYNVVGEKPEMALLSHMQDSGEGYFMLMVQPRLDESLAKAPPREVVFLVDVSGSMGGEPTAKVKQTMAEFLKLSKPEDTIQVITFASNTSKLFEKPLPATEENVAKAVNYTQDYSGGGGTEMMKGIRMVLDEPVDPQRKRIVVMLTDGFIGNEAEIIKAVGEKAGENIHFWTLGIGSSPNRFLLDGVAKQGGGMSAVIELNTDPSEIVRKIVERIHHPQIAQIQIDWKGLPVFETYPRKIPELWAGRPVILFGRFYDGGAAKIELKGVSEGKPVSYKLGVNLPFGEVPEHDVLAKVWARNKIEDLSAQMGYGDVPEVVEEITNVALKYRLMSQYTSFVAVDESEARAEMPARPPRRMVVPVPLPDGVSYAGVFGEEGGQSNVPGEMRLLFDGKTVTGVPGPAGQPGAQGLAGPGGPLVMNKLRLSIVGGTRFGIAGTQVLAAGGLLRGRADAVKAHLPNIQPLQGSIAFSNAPLNTEGAVQTWISPPGVKPFADVPGDHWASRAILPAANPARHSEARKAFEEAQALQKKGELLPALLKAQQAYLLETAFLTSNPGNNDGTAEAITELLQALPEELGAQYAIVQPALRTRLKLVVRDQSLAQALHAVATAAGLQEQLMPGSLADACALEQVPELRVHYLDLRGASAAQALDWLLTPAHLLWQPEGKNIITVTSARRLPVNAAWVYDVGALIQPDAKEHGENEQQQGLAAVNAFLKAVRLILPQQEESGLAPGAAVMLDGMMLSVYGNQAIHAKVAEFLTALRDGTPCKYIDALQGADLQAVKALQLSTAARWKAREPEISAQHTARAKSVDLLVLGHAAWQMLADAASGEVEKEALTEAQIAWRNLAVRPLPQGGEEWLLLRAAWAITEAARMQPKDVELRTLASVMLTRLSTQFTPALTALTQKPDDAISYFDALYAALLLRNAESLNVGLDNGKKLTADLQGLLLKERKASPLAVVCALAACQLAPTADMDAALRKAISEHQLSGEDLLTQTGLLARNRGGQLWQAYREELPTLTTRQALDGAVVVLLNRLAMVQIAAQHVR